MSDIEAVESLPMTREQRTVDPECFCAEIDSLTQSFFQVQQQCGTLLQSGISDELSRCYDERQRIFERLQKIMEEWRSTPKFESSKDVIYVLQKNLRIIMDEEKKLEHHACNARKELEEALCALRKGKVGLSRYSHEPREDSPRFLSNRM